VSSGIDLLEVAVVVAVFGVLLFWVVLPALSKKRKDKR
jgi:competence protein ComGC